MHGGSVYIPTAVYGPSYYVTFPVKSCDDKSAIIVVYLEVRRVFIPQLEWRVKVHVTQRWTELERVKDMLALAQLPEEVMKISTFSCYRPRTFLFSPPSLFHSLRSLHQNTTFPLVPGSLTLICKNTSLSQPPLISRCPCIPTMFPSSHFQSVYRIMNRL